MTSKRVPYIFLLITYVFFTTIFAGLELNWTSAIGYNLVPLFISYLMIKKSSSPKHLVVASIAAVFLFIALNASGMKTRYDLNYATVYTGCFERNVAVAQMATEAEKEQFCSCFTTKIATFAMRQDALVFYGLSEMSEVNQSSAATEFLTDAFLQCSPS